MSIERPNKYLDYLIDPSFEGVNRLSVFSFENNAHKTRFTEYLIPKVEIKDYNVMIHGQKFFHQPVKMI